MLEDLTGIRFPYFFVGTFIEAGGSADAIARAEAISLLFRRDFH